MNKGIIWAIKIGLSIRNMINKNGCNDFYFHINSNGESVLQGTGANDNNLLDIIKMRDEEEEEIDETSHIMCSENNGGENE